MTARRRPPVGAHVKAAHPLRAAAECGAEAVQVFIGNARSWAPPQPSAAAMTLRGFPGPVYVHAAYLINVASPDPVVRARSIAHLDATVRAADALGAVGVVVHPGHAPDGVAAGVARWRAALDDIKPVVRVLLENQAGGPNALARSLDGFAPLWEAIGHLHVGVCLDTCHLHAAGEPLTTAVARVRSMTGRIDLVHANDSRDPAGSGRDRHEHVGKGTIDPRALAAVVRDAWAPVIVEVDDEGRADDLAWLRRCLARATTRSGP